VLLPCLCCHPVVVNPVGIIGAKNQGSGIAGVVPGMPLIAFKVLGRDGSGPLDGIYKGYAEIISRQQKGEKIIAINLSLGSPVMDADSLAVECDWVKKLASYGTTVVAAAGEDGEGVLECTCRGRVHAMAAQQQSCRKDMTAGASTQGCTSLGGYVAMHN